MVRINNNAFGTLAGSILSGAVTIALTAGHGARFPAATTGGDYFYATLIDASGNTEIILVTNRSTDSLTALRAQDGTTARAFSGGDRIELRPINATMQALQQEAMQVAVAAGTDTYTASLSPVPPALNTLQIYAIKFTNANTQAATLNLNGLGAKSIVLQDGSALAVGDIIAGAVCLLTYDGTNFVFLNRRDTTPTGRIVDCAYTAIDTGYLGCDGSAVSRTTYARLFAKIGTTFGVGDGSTTFNVPDHRRRVAVGSGGVAVTGPANTLGAVGGQESITLAAGHLPPHTHNGSGSTGDVSADHTHNVVVTVAGGGGTPGGGNIGAPSLSNTTSGASNGHTHAYSFTTDGGNGLNATAFTIFQPSLVVVKAIRV